MIGLQAIYGIGPTRAKVVCDVAGVDPATKIKDLLEEQLKKVRDAVAAYTVEGDLRREVSMNIKRKIDLGCYQGSTSPSRFTRAWSTYQNQRPYPQRQT